MSIDLPLGRTAVGPVPVALVIGFLALFGQLQPARAAADAPAAAVEPSAEVQSAIVAVIRAQLDAFRRDDGRAAFAHASPSIQGKFGTVERFMAMVQIAYPAVYRPRAVEVLDARIIDPHTAQAMKIIDDAGQALVAIYFMELQPDGSWRIDGVQVIPLQELSS